MTTSLTAVQCKITAIKRKDKGGWGGISAVNKMEQNILLYLPDLNYIPTCLPLLTGPSDLSSFGHIFLLSFGVFGSYLFIWTNVGRGHGIEICLERLQEASALPLLRGFSSATDSRSLVLSEHLLTPSELPGHMWK